jgi:serine protease Do
MAVPLANSDELVVGQSIICIGAPLGLKHTLTTGIVSAIRAGHGNDLSFFPKDVIQTDAAINQGNSGGALFNSRGEVVGIASFITSQTGGSVGLGFAVPSNAVRRRLFERAIPFFGLVLRRVPKPLAELLNWPTQQALLVEKVLSNSPAAKAGMRGGFIPTDFAGVKVMMGGDLIIKVGDYEPSETDQIHTYLQGLKVGDSVRYTVVRGGQVLEGSVTLEEVIPIPKLPPPPPPKK